MLSSITGIVITIPIMLDSITGIVIGKITIPVMLDSITGIVILPITIPVMLSGHLLPLPVLLLVKLQYRYC